MTEPAPGELEAAANTQLVEIIQKWCQHCAGRAGVERAVPMFTMAQIVSAEVRKIATGDDELEVGALLAIAASATRRLGEMVRIVDNAGVDTSAAHTGLIMTGILSVITAGALGPIGTEVVELEDVRDGRPLDS